MRVDINEGLAGQLEDYRARAPECDAWVLRRGRYDHGEAPTAQWFCEGAELAGALPAIAPAHSRFAPEGHVLRRDGTATGRLADGARSTSQVGSIEMVYEPEPLQRNPRGLGGHSSIRQTHTYFIFGEVARG